jgi:hypothetical protein
MHVYKEKAGNWFCWGNNLRDKCPVYNHLPSVGVCVFLSRVLVPLIAHSLHPECHCGDGRAVRAVTRQLLEEVYHLNKEKACFPGLGRQAHGSQISFLLLHTNLLFSYHARKKALERKAIWQY